VTFQEVLAQVITWLEHDKRLSYRALQRQFDLDEAYLDDLKFELLEVKQLAVDQDGKMLVWTGDNAPATPPAAPPASPQDREPLAYTPPHLAEKILTSRSALEGERKQVTVLFCDLTNSTPLAERLGPERMHTLLNRFFELAIDAELLSCARRASDGVRPGRAAPGPGATDPKPCPAPGGAPRLGVDVILPGRSSCAHAPGTGYSAL